jgi:hypothetical protein
MLVNQVGAIYVFTERDNFSRWVFKWRYIFRLETPILRLDEEHWSAAVTIADHMFIAKLDVRVFHAW